MKVSRRHEFGFTDQFLFMLFITSSNGVLRFPLEDFLHFSRLFLLEELRLDF